MEFSLSLTLETLISRVTDLLRMINDDQSIAMKMSEIKKSASCPRHRPPHLIFCEDNGKGCEDDHEDDISNSLTSMDDRDPRPSHAIDEHDKNNNNDNNDNHSYEGDDNDKHHRSNSNQSQQRKEVEKRTEEEENENDDDAKQSYQYSHCHSKPDSSTITATLSSDLILQGVDTAAEQIILPGGNNDAQDMITPMSTTATAMAASAITTNINNEAMMMTKCDTASMNEALTRIAIHDDDDDDDDDNHRDTTERNELPVQHVGRVIGKGGEMIRDLQARSGCRIDVDQNVASPNAPRYITYHGQTQEDIDLAKLLVSMVCQSNMGDEEGEQLLHNHHYHPIELPLGKAVRRYIQVHKSVVGRIIGRGGDMIRDLQVKSHARIQVDHKGEYSAGVAGGDGGGDEEEGVPSSTAPPSSNEHQFRQVMITGTEESVQRAEAMISQLSNRHHDELECRHQQQYDHQQHRTTSSDIPSVDTGMEPYWDQRSPFEARVAPFASNSTSGYGGVYGPSSPPQQGSFPTPTWNANSYTSNPLLLPTMINTEIIPCPKENIGHIIGRRGVTVNDLQWRSGCNIQVDRKGCKISISGSRQGIEMAKNMIYNIYEHGPNHMYASGRQQQMDEQEVVIQHDEHALPVSSQFTANPFPYLGGGVQNPSQAPTYLYSRPMIQRGYYPNLSQPLMMYSQLPQRQVLSPQQLLQPSIQDPNMAPPSEAAAVSLWREAITMDGRMYYYNINTMETRWDKPE